MVSSIWDSCSKINHYDLKTALVNKPLWRGALHDVHCIFLITYVHFELVFASRSTIYMRLWGARNLTYLTDIWLVFINWWLIIYYILCGCTVLLYNWIIQTSNIIKMCWRIVKTCCCFFFILHAACYLVCICKCNNRKI